jgi:hypothetical protein
VSLDDFQLASAESPEPDSQFLPNTKVQYAWDSTSITNILACPRRYQYSIVQGLTPRNPGFAIALVFGILFHKGMEYYHEARAAGADHNEALHDSVRKVAALPATATLPTDGDVAADAAEADADDDGITQRNSKVRTRYYLFRAIVWYLEHYADDPAATIILPSGKPAVELSFRLPLELQGVDHPILLCGHIDRGVEFNGALYVADYKTTKSVTRQFFDTFLLSHQLTGYTIAGSAIFDRPVRGALVDGIALQVGGVKLGRAPTQRTPGQVKEYFRTLTLAATTAQRCHDDDFYPMNTSACYFCDFKSICSQPPEVRERYLSQHFERKRGWNPLENR